jgi:hypothetical protein
LIACLLQKNPPLAGFSFWETGTLPEFRGDALRDEIE